jgi:hypothetical protein
MSKDHESFWNKWFVRGFSRMGIDPKFSPTPALARSASVHGRVLILLPPSHFRPARGMPEN